MAVNAVIDDGKTCQIAVHFGKEHHTFVTVPHRVEIVFVEAARVSRVPLGHKAAEFVEIELEQVAQGCVVLLGCLYDFESQAISVSFLHCNSTSLPILPGLWHAPAAADLVQCGG